MVSQVYRQNRDVVAAPHGTWLLGFAIAGLCFSYPLTTMIMLQLGLPVSSFNFYIKATFSVSFIIVLFWRIKLIQPIHVNYVPLLFFLTVYSIRLVYDQSILGLRMGFSSDFYIYSYYFLLSFVPLLVLGFCLRKGDIPALYRSIFYLLVLTCIVQTAYVYLGGAVDEGKALSGRVQVEGDLEGTSLLNPIHLGMSGATLSAFCLGRMLFLKSFKPWQHIVNVGLIFLGILNILFSGSRGPLLGLVVVFFAIALAAMMRSGRSGTTNKWGIILLLVLPVLFGIYAMSIERGTIYLVDRVSDFFVDRSQGSREERDFVFASVWQDFLENPVFGKAFVTSVDSGSPHNVPLEVLMSTGLVGGSVFGFAFFKFMKAYLNIFRTRTIDQLLPIAVGAIPTFTLGLSSGSIADAPSFWLCFATLTLLGQETVRAFGTQGSAYADPRNRKFKQSAELRENGWVSRKP